MLENETYANGQRVYELEGNKLTYFYKDGKLKAEGPFENGLMQGEWIFYRGTGELWQIAHFKDNQKDGSWIRYDKKGQIEYRETFANGKIVKKQTDK